MPSRARTTSTFECNSALHPTAWSLRRKRNKRFYPLRGRPPPGYPALPYTQTRHASENKHECARYECTCTDLRAVASTRTCSDADARRSEHTRALRFESRGSTTPLVHVRAQYTHVNARERSCWILEIRRQRQSTSTRRIPGRSPNPAGSIVEISALAGRSECRVETIPWTRRSRRFSV